MDVDESMADDHVETFRALDLETLTIAFERQCETEERKVAAKKRRSTPMYPMEREPRRWPWAKRGRMVIPRIHAH